jgi:hypothetical protein
MNVNITTNTPKSEPSLTIQRQSRYMLFFITVGIVTMKVSAFATWSFDQKCRDLQCAGVIWFGAANIASLIGLLPIVSFCPGLENSYIGKHLFASTGLRILAIVMILFTWFVIITSIGYW